MQHCFPTLKRNPDDLRAAKGVAVAVALSIVVWLAGWLAYELTAGGR